MGKKEAIAFDTAHPRPQSLGEVESEAHYPDCLSVVEPHSSDKMEPEAFDATQLRISVPTFFDEHQHDGGDALEWDDEQLPRQPVTP